MTLDPLLSSHGSITTRPPLSPFPSPPPPHPAPLPSSGPLEGLSYNLDWVRVMTSLHEREVGPEDPRALRLPDGRVALFYNGPPLGELSVKKTVRYVALVRSRLLPSRSKRLTGCLRRFAPALPLPRPRTARAAGT